VTLPGDVKAIDYPPTFVTVRGRVYIYGTWSPCVVMTDDLKLYRQGLPALAVPFSVASSGTGGLSDTFECKVTQVHKVDGALVHESNGGELVSVTCAGTSRVWTLPSTGYEKRATHRRGYVRGSATQTWRMAWEREVSVTSVTEEVSTLALGAEMPTENDVPPYLQFAQYYMGRCFGAGDIQNPSYIRYSELGKPEAMADNSWIRTSGQESATAMKRKGQKLMVFTAAAVDAVRGYNESTDLRIDRVTPGFGCISHHSLINIDERLWYMSAEGFVIFDDSPQIVSDKIRRYFRTAYQADRGGYERSFAVYDPYFRTYLCHVRKSSGSFRYVGYVPPVRAGEQPWWYFDQRNRTDTAIGIWSAANSLEPIVVVGANDGLIRQENYEDDYTDDSETDTTGVGIKRVTVQSRHEPGDDDHAESMEGKTFNHLDIFLTSENNTFTPSMWGGQVQAAQGATAHWSPGAVAASYDATLTPQWEHNFSELGNVIGAGATLKIVTDQARRNWRFQGYAMGYGPGSNIRTPVA
jgi:hypothetical protein